MSHHICLSIKAILVSKKGLRKNLDRSRINNEIGRQCFNSDDCSATVRLSDGIITAIFNPHWQTQYIPGLSTCCWKHCGLREAHLVCLCPGYIYISLNTLGIFMTKAQHCFSFWKEAFPPAPVLWWKLCLCKYFHNVVQRLSLYYICNIQYSFPRQCWGGDITVSSGTSKATVTHSRVCR